MNNVFFAYILTLTLDTSKLEISKANLNYTADPDTLLLHILSPTRNVSMCIPYSLSALVSDFDNHVV